MHIRCGSRIFQKGVQMKKQGSRRFLQFSLQFFLYFSEKGGFYTLDPLLWWLNQKHEDTGNLKGGSVLMYKMKYYFVYLLSG
jgi:hypothetical protein